MHTVYQKNTTIKVQKETVLESPLSLEGSILQDQVFLASLNT